MSTSKGAKLRKVLAMNEAAPRTMEELLTKFTGNRAFDRNERRKQEIERLKSKIAGSKVRQKKAPKPKSTAPRGKSKKSKTAKEE